MVQYAYRNLSTTISLVPGDVRMYRLPIMMPGEFVLQTSGQLIIPRTAGQPSEPGHAAMPAQSLHPSPAVRSAPTLRGIADVRDTAGAISALPGHLPPPGVGAVDVLMDLFHGDELVASGTNGLPLQLTPSEGDNTWRVRVQLAPNSPSATYRVTLSLIFPSMLPILTKCIPLAFFQQLFDTNWNGRSYVSIALEQNNLLIHFDPELASYHHLSDIDHVMDSKFLVTLPNVMTRDVQLSINNSSAEGYDGLAGQLPYIRLTVRFTGINNQPISGSAYGFDINVHDFSIDVHFFLCTVPGVVGDVMGSNVGYVSQVTTDLVSQLYDTNGSVVDYISDQLNSYLTEAQNFLDLHAEQVGAAVTPWLLGAGFDVLNVRYDSTSSQPVPPWPSPYGDVDGDIVIDYVGQAPATTSGGVLTEVNPPSALTITTAAMANGVIEQPYLQGLTATAGTPPYTWTLAGTLPPGTTFTGSTLSGMPTTPGAYTLHATVLDASGTQVSRAYILAINPAGLSITTTSPLPKGVAGQPYVAVLAIQGGTAPYHWMTSSLPNGLSISTSGVIAGTTSGNESTSTIVVKVTDAQGVSAWSPLVLTLLDPELFPEPFYVPRGDGDTIWKAPARSGPISGSHHGPQPSATTPGDLSKIEHIVVVMMENRSFDHMLGYLSKEGGRRDVEGLKWENDDNRTQFNYYNGRFYYPVPLTDTGIFSTEDMSPDHSHESVRSQMTDGMAHFIADFAKKKVGDNPDLLRLVMGYYGADELPIYDLLARDFAICDHWFCSHVGPTWPNRFVTLTGDLNRDSYGEPEVDTPLSTDFTPSEATTLFDLLSERGVSWQYFEQNASMIRAFTKYTFDMVNVLQYSHPTRGFKAAVQAGLKSVTFVDPLFGDLPAGVGSPQDNDDAPPSNLQDGQRFIWDVVSTLFTPSSNPNWMTTMLIIVYDEHGGFYDHVVPPDNATPLLGQNSGKLGPRVPAFVVSPWTPQGYVLKDTFDHTTIAATILRRFCSPHPPVMSPRVTAALDLRGALPLATARGQLTPLLGWSGDFEPLATRTIARPFRAKQASGSFVSLLGALGLMLGSPPK